VAFRANRAGDCISSSCSGRGQSRGITPLTSAQSVTATGQKLPDRRADCGLYRKRCDLFWAMNLSSAAIWTQASELVVRPRRSCPGHRSVRSRKLHEALLVHKIVIIVTCLGFYPRLSRNDRREFAKLTAPIWAGNGPDFFKAPESLLGGITEKTSAVSICSGGPFSSGAKDFGTVCFPFTLPLMGGCAFPLERPPPIFLAYSFNIFVR